MWILTNVGYVCAVVHRDDVAGFAGSRVSRARIMVRARSRRHLETMFPGEEVLEWTDADFRYRVVISRAAFKKWLANQADLMDYESFKHSTEDQELHRQYVEWWEIGLRYQKHLERNAVDRAS